MLVAHHAVERSTLGDTTAAHEKALAAVRQELAEAQAVSSVAIADHEHAQVTLRLRAIESMGPRFARDSLSLLLDSCWISLRFGP